MSVKRKALHAVAAAFQQVADSDLEEQGFDVDATQVGLEHIGVLKTADIQRTLFKDLVFHVKTVDLPALDKGLSLEPLPNQRAAPKTFDLLDFVQPGIF
jgi:hypothetical protein